MAKPTGSPAKTRSHTGPSVLAIVSKQCFKKDFKLESSGQLAGIGDTVSVKSYVSTNAKLEVLREGGDLFLVSVRPDESLCLVAVLESPKFKSDRWIAKRNTTPLTPIDGLRDRIQFASGKGISAAPGKLGMSLQTPRELTPEDVALLRDAARSPYGDLIARLRAWVTERGQTSDEGQAVRLKKPATPKAVNACEAKIGIKLPRALRALYLGAANGGFGPASGLSPVSRLRVTRQGYVALFDWGCELTAGLDMRNPEGPLLLHDPYCSEAHPDYVWTDADELFPSRHSLVGYLSSWLGGLNLCDEFSEEVSRQIPKRLKALRVWDGELLG